MRDLLMRLRAALTPQALILLFLLFLFLGLADSFTGGAFGSDSGTALEERTEAALSSVSGAGSVRVVIRTREEEQSGRLVSGGERERIPCGAVAVAQGASDPWVRMQLQEALCTLLGLPASAVSVVAGGK